jgi:hypothetical protein
LEAETSSTKQWTRLTPRIVYKRFDFKDFSCFLKIVYDVDTKKIYDARDVPFTPLALLDIAVW